MIQSGPINVLQIVNTVTIGGAESFMLRLSTAIKSRGQSVAIVVLRGDLVDEDFLKRIAPSIKIYRIIVPMMEVFQKIDALLYFCGISLSLVRTAQSQRLSSIIRRETPDAIHSHLITSDLVVARSYAFMQGAKRPIWITTMHGDYLSLERAGRNRAARIVSFKDAAHKIRKSVDAVVCISKQQEQQIRKLMPSLSCQNKIKLVYNGYQFSPISSDVTPAPLASIPKGDFVVGMVSRGIAEKGWDTLIDAFEQLQLADAWLVLVGDGKDLQALRQVNTNPKIIFCGKVLDPLRYIRHFDVACLPSRYSAESLPTVIIEYLVMGKPVVATDVGEIANMLDIPGHGSAGLLVSLGHDTTEALSERLKEMYMNRELRHSMSVNALRAACCFNMDTCVDAYLAAYVGEKKSLA